MDVTKHKQSNSRQLAGEGTLFTILIISVIIMLMLVDMCFSQTILYHFRVLGNRLSNTRHCDLSFQFFDSPNNGRQLSEVITKSNVMINESSFTVELDLAGIDTRKGCWLETRVRSGNDSDFTVLSRRCKLNSSLFHKKKLNDKYVAISKVKKVALNQARRLWGQVEAGKPVACYDSNDNLYVYMCPFRIGDSAFPQYEKIVEQIEKSRQWEDYINETYAAQKTDHSVKHKLDEESYHASLKAAKNSQLGIGEYGVIYVSARYDSYPIVMSSNYLPPYFTRSDIVHKSALKKTGKDFSSLNRYYFLGPSGQAFGMDCDGEKIILHSHLLKQIDDKIVSSGFTDSDLDYTEAWKVFSSDSPPAPSDIHNKRIQEWEIMPCVNWCRGCTPTSASMVLGYYDRGGLGAEFLGYGRLIDYWRYFSKYIDNREEAQVNVPNVLNELRQDMQTNADGETQVYNISSGIEKTCNDRNGYSFSSQWIQCNLILNDWCWDNIVDEINNDRPFVWSSGSTEDLEKGHSLAAFGYIYDDEDTDYKYVMTYNTWDCPGQDDWHYRHYNHGPEQLTAQMNTVVPAGGAWGQTSLHVPNGGETWGVGTSQKIWWYEDDQRTWSGELEYSTDGGVTWNPIATVEPSSPGWHSYTWTVPNEPTEEARVRIKNFSGSADTQWNLQAADGSEEDFKITEPTLHIGIPYFNTVWYTGQVHEILWSDSGAGDFVKIERSDDAGATWYTIAESTYNDGSFHYEVTSPTGNQATIRISSTELPSVTHETGTFEVKKPFITLSEPVAGAELYPEINYGIRWASGGIGDFVDIDLSRDGGQSWEEIIHNTEDDGYHYWQASGPASSQCRIRISSVDNPMLYNRSFFDFHILSPSLQLLGPEEGQTFYLEQSYQIQWVAGGVNGYISIKKSTDAGETWQEVYTISASRGYYNWTVDGPTSESCLLKIASIEDPKLVSISKAFRTERCINILYPAIDETCYIGDLETIKWLPGGTGQNVQIHIKENGSDQWTEIVDSTLNDGQYSWEVLGNENLHQIRITPIDYPDLEAYSQEFSIDQWQLLSPNGGEIWHGGETYTVSWSGQKSERNVKLELTLDGGTVWYPQGNYPCSGQADIEIDSNINADQCQMRISLETSPSCVDESESDFEINSPFIKVLTPIGSNTYFVGDNCRIRWDSKGAGKTVKIEVIRQSLLSGWQEIVSNTPNDGLYNWTVSGPESELSMIRISSIELPGYYAMNPNHYFSIEQRPGITLEYPNKNQVLYPGQPCNLVWDSFEAGQNVKIEASYDGGTTWTIIADQTENDGSYLWNVDETLSDDYLIKITSVEQPDITNSSKQAFSVAPQYTTFFSTGPEYDSGGGAAMVGPQNMMQHFDADQALQFVPADSGYGLTSVSVAVKTVIDSWNNKLDIHLMNDVDDHPGEILASTYVLVDHDPAWQTAVFAEAIPLQKGVPYWIMCSVGTNGYIPWHFADPKVPGKLMNRKDMGPWKYWDIYDKYMDSCVAIIINGVHVPDQPAYPDVVDDKTIDIKDVVAFSSSWMQSDCNGMTNQWCNQADINRSGRVDMDDWLEIAKQWLDNIPED